MASPCKAAGETQASSPGLILDTPRQRVHGHPLHGAAPDMSPDLPPSAKVPTYSPTLMQEPLQCAWPDTLKTSAVGLQHANCRLSKTVTSSQTSAEGAAIGRRRKRAAIALPSCQPLLASGTFWSLLNAALAILFFSVLASKAGNRVTEMDHETSCTARHAMSLSNPEDMCVVGFKPSDPTARQSSSLLFCQMEWFDNVTVQEFNQLHQEGWLVLVDSITDYGVSTAWYVCTNFLSPNISDVLGGDDLTKWGPWAGQAHKEIDHWNAALVHDFTVDPQCPHAMASSLTELFARALHACGAIQYYYTVEDILGLTAGNDTLSTPRFKPTPGCDMGAESVVQGMTESFRNLTSDSQEASFASNWTRQELNCLNFTYESCPHITESANSNLLYDDKDSCYIICPMNAKNFTASSFNRLVRNFLIDSLRNESAPLSNTFYIKGPQIANSAPRSIKDQPMNGTQYFHHRSWTFLPSLLYTPPGQLYNRTFGMLKAGSIVETFNDFSSQGTFTWRIIAGEDKLWLNVTQNSSTSQCLANSKWSDYLAPPFVTNISHGRNRSVWLMPSTFKPYLCSGGVDIEAADSFSSFLLAAQQQLADGHSFFKINVNSYNDLYAVFTATLGCVFGAVVAFIVIAIVGIARGIAKCCGLQVPAA